MDYGVLHEVAELEFADDRRIYLPIENMNLLSRYIGGKKGTPKLSKVGGKTWAKARETAQDSVNELAVEMLRLAAVRQQAPGHCCAKDNEWKEMFEDAFPYE